MGKLLTFGIIIATISLVALIGLTGFREYQKLQLQLLNSSSAIFSMANIRSKLSQLPINVSKVSHKPKFNITCRISLSNSQSLTLGHLRTLIKELQMTDQTYSLQQIDFGQNKFTATGLLFYKLKEVFEKFFLPKDLSHQNKTQIKIFNLQQWNEHNQRYQALKLALNSVQYYTKYETGRLFWYQSSKGVLKSQKPRNQTPQVYVFIVVDEHISPKRYKAIQKQIIKNLITPNVNFILFQKSSFSMQNKKREKLVID